MRDTLPVTAVIPAYRRPDMVERAVRSVFAQTRPPAEVIVVDDASGDDTGARAAALGARVITHERNLGEGGARNTGIEAATNDWVALLDCDDEWLPGHLETLWPHRDGHVLVGGAVLVRGDSETPRAWGWTGPGRCVMKRPADIVVPQNKFHPSSTLLRRDALLAVGGFPDLVRAADLDTWLRMVERGTALALPHATALYHRHPAQISSDALPMLTAQEEVLRRYEDRPWCTTALRQRQAGIHAWDRFRASLVDDSPVAPAALTLARHALHPQCALGIVQLWVARYMNRRLASKYADDGSATVAILPGARFDPAELAYVEDLRGMSLPRGVLHLVRHPTARAAATGRLTCAFLKAIGIDPQ